MAQVYSQFNYEQRKELHLLLKKDFYTFEDIWEIIWKDKSSISREIKRNSVNGIYDPNKAEHKAYVRERYRAWQWKNKKVAANPFLERVLKVFLPDHSPEQIAGRLNIYFWKQVISHVSIYTFCYSKYTFCYSNLWQEYCKYLYFKRNKPKKYKKKQESKNSVCRILHRTSIEERPVHINNRSSPFNWETDILWSKKIESDRVWWLTERTSRLVKFFKLNTLGQFMSKLKEIISDNQEYFNSVTFDNWVENKLHYILFLLWIATYFCHPYTSCEKASIENTFWRLRRYIPRSVLLSTITQNDLDRIANIMNNTPRKCLGYKTPNEVFFEQKMLMSKSFHMQCTTRTHKRFIQILAFNQIST